jgi:prepilin-type processing-associated H-X9-DG protein
MGNVVQPHLEEPQHVTDGLSKTLLTAEYTNRDFDLRRTMWAYTYTYIMSQTVDQPRVFMDAYCGGNGANLCGIGGCVATGESGTFGAPNASAGHRVCKRSWYSFHPGGMNAAMCDGSSDFISFDTNLKVFAAMGSIAGEDSEFSNDAAPGSRR